MTVMSNIVLPERCCQRAGGVIVTVIVTVMSNNIVLPEGWGSDSDSDE